MAHSTRPSGGVAEGAGGPHPCIVAVNSDVEFLALLRLALNSAGYSVATVVEDGAFERIAALHPAAIIVDLVAGERAGWDLLESLRQTRALRAIPVLVTATRADDLALVEGDSARYAGDRFLVKPFDRAELLAAIDRLIGPA